MLVGAAAEMATIGTVFPFLALLTDPSLADDYPKLLHVFKLLGWDGERSVLLYAAIFFSMVVVAAAAIRIALSWFSYRLTFTIGADIGSEVYRHALYQPYSFHVTRNTSEIIAGINKVHRVVMDAINPLMQSLVALVISLAILAVLIGIEPFAASIAILGFTMLYVTASLLTRQKLRANSKIIARNENLRVQAIQEGLGGIRDVLIDGTQPVFVTRFNIYDRAQRNAQATNSFISYAPRYFIEAIGIVLIVAIAFWLSLRDGGLSTAVPVLGALALGAQKLLPQMQLLYRGWASISGSRHMLQDVIELLEQPIPNEYLQVRRPPSLTLSHRVALKNVSFRYQENTPDVVSNVSLEITRGSRIGLKGKTGSGKSTLVDLVMGLLEPTSGRIEIDGKPLTAENRREWQACIAHVPQNIYLTDASIAENIAFGIDPPEIDQKKLRVAATKAQLADFIETLPQAYMTQVGERGVQLSGGQRQRIGIARALYKEPQVLVLDEATSALDEATENSVMDAIYALGDKITILMIAHRLSTLKHCDRIIDLTNSPAGTNLDSAVRVGSAEQRNESSLDR